MRLKITRLDSTIPLPTYGTSEAAGFDLAASQDLTVAPGQVALVRTGLVIEVPTGYFLAIFARSSTPLKRGLIVSNGVGVVDPDYSGPEDEVMIQVLNVTTADVHVKRGDRLAQGIVLPDEGNVLSRTHARLDLQGDRFFLVDQGSSLGTYVKLHGAHSMSSGDEFLAADVRFRVEARPHSH